MRRINLKIILLVLFVLSFLPCNPIWAATSLDVVINEVAWMGTAANSADEWIELYNNTNQDINLEGWGLYEAEGETLIEPLTGVIKAKSYYLIERTDDTTIADIPASQEPSSWGGYGLKNSGEHLQLLDNNSQVIDEVNCLDGWFAGDNGTKATMEMKNPQESSSNPSNWASNDRATINGHDAEGSPINGTPGGKNSVNVLTPQPETQPEPETESETEPETQVAEEQEELQPIAYPSGILINELVPSPEGKDELEEWLELRNINSKEIDISGWKIEDTIGSTKTYVFSEGTKIKANGYLVLTRPVSKITLNNSGDGLKLIQPNDNIIDSVNYEKASRGQSYNRTESGWLWSTILTPGEKNTIPEKEPSSIKTSGNKKITESEARIIGKQKSEINLATPKPKLPVFLIALAIAIISGITVLFLKKTLKTEKPL